MVFGIPFCLFEFMLMECEGSNSALPATCWRHIIVEECPRSRDERNRIERAHPNIGS